MSFISGKFSIVMHSAVLIAVAAGSYWFGRAEVSRSSSEDARASRFPSSDARRQKRQRAGAAETFGEFRQAMRNSSNPISMLKGFSALADADMALLEELLAKADSLSGVKEKRWMIPAIFARMAELDGATAAELLTQKNYSGQLGEAALNTVVSVWSQDHPAEALGWYRERAGEDLAFEQKNGRALSAILSSFARKDPDAALESMKVLDARSKSDALYGFVEGAVYSPEGIDAAKRFIEAASPVEKTPAEQLLLHHWTSLDPDEAVKYVESHGATKQQKETVGMVLLNSNPRKGAEFLLNGATEAEKPALYERIVGGWSYNDANAAGTWLGEQPPGPQLDKAKQAFVMSAANHDLDSAMKWAKTISDPDKAEMSITGLYYQCKGKDPKQAEAFLDGSGLPAEKIKSIRDEAAKPIIQNPGMLPPDR